MHRASLAQKGWGKRAQHRLHWGWQWGQAIWGGPCQLALGTLSTEWLGTGLSTDGIGGRQWE